MRSFIASQFRRVPVIIATTVLVSALTTTLVASQVIQGILSGEGGAQRGIQVKSEDFGSSTTSTTPVDVPGATITFVVPTGETWLLLARWTSEMTCSSGGFCQARILLDGSPMEPIGLTDTTVHSGNTQEAHSIERFRARVPAGTHTVKVQYWNLTSGSTFILDDWLFVAQAWKAI